MRLVVTRVADPRRHLGRALPLVCQKSFRCTEPPASTSLEFDCIADEGRTAAEIVPDSGLRSRRRGETAGGACVWALYNVSWRENSEEPPSSVWTGAASTGMYHAFEDCRPPGTGLGPPKPPWPFGGVTV